MAFPSLTARVVDLVMTDDQRQRIRLAQAQLALAMMLAGIAAMQLGAARGVVRSDGLMAWTWLSASGFIAVFLLIRSGWTKRLRDPSLTLAQMLHGTACAAWSYHLAGSAHAVAPLVQALILVFGMFGMSSRQVLGIAAYALVLFAGVMAWECHVDPVRYRLVDDLMLFIVMGSIVVAIVILTMRLNHMRRRMRAQRHALQDALDQIERLATHDELTGLANRRRMQSLLADAHALACRDARSFSLALLDLDHFKRVNDQHGHACGDDVLRGFATRAAATLRESDTLARWGGEEFVLLMPATGLEAAATALDRVRTQVTSQPVTAAGLSMSITFSAGLVQARPGESLEQMLERADQLCYRAKLAGRDRIEREPALPERTPVDRDLARPATPHLQ